MSSYLSYAYTLVLSLSSNTAISSPVSFKQCQVMPQAKQEQSDLPASLYRHHRDAFHFIVTDYRPIVSNILADEGAHLDSLFDYLNTQHPERLITYSRCLLQYQLSAPDFARALIHYSFPPATN